MSAETDKTLGIAILVVCAVLYVCRWVYLNFIEGESNEQS